MYFIKTKSIETAYMELASIDVKNASVFHIYMILKGCGFNDLSYKSVSDIGNNGLAVAHDLSMLFSPDELKPSKYEFINPFSMQKWADQAPSEPLKKWVSSRIKNNIIGGATTWRKIVKEDIYKGQIKFSYNYVKEIKDLTLPDKKINLWALTIWFYRFAKFDSKLSPGELIQSFRNQFDLNDKEINSFFETTINFEVQFADKIVEMATIRSMIGSHAKFTQTWIESIPNDKTIIEEYQTKTLKLVRMNNYPTIEKVTELLKKNYQVILSGPPGTSKSFIADQIGQIFIDKYGQEAVLKMQFHPQYSYQDFIGGFIVRGESVESNRGMFLTFIDQAKSDSSKEYLLIIDEINRANTSSVFGEVIQCLDRDYSSKISLAGVNEEIQIPKNLFIIGTMNTADRTLGSMDFALRRRFINIYIPPNEDELIDKVELESKLSAKDFLNKINNRLSTTLQNPELVVGQTIFYNSNYKVDEKYVWNKTDFEDLFNYKILPIIEDYCNRDQSKLSEVVGDTLINRVTGEEFEKAIAEYIV